MQKPDPSLVSVVAQAGERAANTPVPSLFNGRWPPRSLTGEAIPDEILFSLFEAARHAPSSHNSQPWRFAYAKRGEPDFAIFLACLNDGDRAWARNASALVMVASKAVFTLEGATEKLVSRSASFDTGAAWACLAMQAEHLGWTTRAIGDFDGDLARAATHAPDSLKIEVVVAVGKRGDASPPADERRPFEKPAPRKAMDEIAFAGGFSADC